MNTQDLGHWITSIDFCPDDWFGFVYRVTNLQNQMEYIGRKYFFSKTRKKIKGRKNRKVMLKESNWREYTTSSSRINTAINEHGKDIFKFEIIELCKTKGDLTYREVEIQWKEKVLSAKLNNGERKYYNNSIGAVRFQLSKHREETKKKMSESAQGNTNAKGAIRSKETRRKMSIAKAGRKLSQTTKIKLSEINKGKESSEETKKKISIAHKGKVTSAATKDKMSQAAIDRKYIKPIECIINGIKYPSISKAAKDLNLGKGVISRRISSIKYVDYTLI